MKKIIVLLCMITSIFALTACGQEKETVNCDPAAVEMAAQNVTSLVLGPHDQVMIDQLNNMTSHEWDMLEETWAQNGLYISGDALLKGIDSFRTASEDIGEVTNTTLETVIAIGSHDVIVTVPITGTVHDANIELLFDENLEIKSVSTNVNYSMSELMSKAGLNTLLGMGSVFAVLILIMFIIGLFKYIAIFENKSKTSKKADSIEKTIDVLDKKEEIETVNNSELEVVAAIAAAIAASEGATTTDGFVVRSIRRR